MRCKKGNHCDSLNYPEQAARLSGFGLGKDKITTIGLPMNIISRRKTKAGTLVLAVYFCLGCSTPLWAQTTLFQTGFESSSGYTSGSTVIGVTDSGANAAWTSILSGAASAITASSASPQSGGLAFQINDASTTTAYGASLNLGSVVSTSSPFTLQFSMALSNLGGSGSAAQIYLGAASVQPGTAKYWTGLVVDASGNISIYTDSTNGTSANAVSLGNYSSYVTAGGYLTFSISIDPSTMKYTSVVLSGSLSTADKVSTIVSGGGSSGTVPYLHNTASLPSLYFDVIGGTASMATISIDNLSIVAVPEPSVLAFLGLGGMLLLWRRRVCMAFFRC